MTVGSMSSHPCASLQRQPDQAEEVRRSLHPLHGFQLAPHVSHKVALDKYRSSFCALLGRRLPHLSLRYAKAQAPTLASLDGLAHLVPENARVAVLSVNTAGTILESVQGGRIVLDYEDFPSVAQLESFFTMEALPSNLVRATRVDYDRKWRSWVTFAAAHGRLEAVFPADLALLRAFVTHMVLCQYTPGTIAQFLACIVTRHKQFGARNIFAWGEFSKWLGGLRKTLGARGKDKFRLRLHHLQSFSKFCPTTLQEVRDQAICFLGVVGARRQSELIALDVCDWRRDMEFDDEGRSFGAAVYIKRQKNDPTMTGMWVRFAYGASEGACVIAKVESWLRMAGIHSHPHCMKWKDARQRSAPCELCGRLFRALSGPHHLKRHRPQLSKQSVGEALNRMLAQSSFEVTGFTSKSLRKGGLSTAKRAGLPAPLRKLQSGHRSAAHKVYESGSDTDEDRMPDVPRQEPRAGWSLRDLYRFSVCFHC